MYVCVCVCVCVCDVSIYNYMRGHTYTWTHFVRTPCLLTKVSVSISFCFIETCMNVCLYTCVHMQMYVYILYMYMSTYIDIYIYIHMCVCVCLCVCVCKYRSFFSPLHIQLEIKKEQVQFATESGRRAAAPWLRFTKIHTRVQYMCIQKVDVPISWLH